VADDFDLLMALWEDGRRRIAAAEPAERRVMEQVVDDIYLDLRRRVGGRFTTTELASYYLSEGTDWAFQIALQVAPSTPEAWDTAAVAGAAFARYARRASDWGGGVRHMGDPDDEP
jgi:hypothetical protein